MTKDQIYRMALASGFTPKIQPDNTMDLHHYVYDFADRLLKSRAAEMGALHQRLDDLMDMCADYSSFVHEIRLAAGDTDEQLTKSALLQRIRQRCSDPENAELDAEFNRFMDWPDPDNRAVVTSTSAKLFAEHWARKDKAWREEINSRIAKHSIDAGELLCGSMVVGLDYIEDLLDP